jgi:hypothetical protein
MTLRPRHHCIETRQTDRFPPPRFRRLFLPRTLLVLASALVLTSLRSAEAQAIRTVPIAANDLAFSALTGRLYASVAATGSITEIDPATGAIGVSIPVGSRPGRVVISDTGEYLYVALDGLPGVVRVHVPTRTVGTPFSLGPPDPLHGARLVDDLSVMPGNPDVVAVSRRFLTATPRHAGVAIYENGVQRPAVTPDGVGSTVIDFGGSAGRLYGYDNETSEAGFRRMDVGANGVTVLDNATALLEGTGLDGEYEGGLVYSTAGHILDPEPRTIVALLSGINPAGSLVEATPGANYYLTGSSPSSDGERSWHLKAFDRVSSALTNDWDVPGVDGAPHGLVHLGGSTLAFADASRIVLISPALLPQGEPVLTITSPTDAPSIAIESATVTLAGTASDPDGSIAAVAWSSSRGFSGAASGTTQWSASDIPLLSGSNVVTVTATDDDGRTRQATLEITVSAYTSLLAEGATGAFFDYDLLLANPAQSAITAAVTFFKESGGSVVQQVALPAQSRRTIRVDDTAGLESTAMSTSVRTIAAPILVERTMRWGQAGAPQYGAHSDKATAGAARTWYFAEGSQGFFFTYLLLANPSDRANTATIDWLIEGAPAQRRVVSLAPRSRTTIDAGADAALAGRSFGIVVTFAEPAVAERAMYFGRPPDVLFKAGHDSAGVNAPATQWILAEGATGPFFETFILLANPNQAAATATLRFLTQSGVEVTRTVTVPATGRTTVNIEALNPAAPELANVAVATVVTATLPIVAERAQYWPGPPSNWYEAHNSFGVNVARTHWGLAEGRVGNPAGLPPANYQTYVLLANPGTTPATVTVTFLRENGGPITRTFVVAAGRRFSVAVAGAGSTVPELADELFGADIRSTAPIVVERSLYGDAGTQVFGIGTNATATPLP